MIRETNEKTTNSTKYEKSRNMKDKDENDTNGVVLALGNRW